MPDGADLVAVMVRSLSRYGARNGQGQDGGKQLFGTPRITEGLGQT